jgi:hypothetical protein
MFLRVSQPSKPSEGYAALAWMFLFGGIALGIFGLYRMHAYDVGDKIVGGDAYNYTILATRGVGFVCAGILSVSVAGVFVLMAIADRVGMQIAVESAAGAAGSLASRPQTPTKPQIACWNCGNRYDDDLTGCPQCGKAKAARL